MIIEFRRSVVAVAIALLRYRGLEGRICRIEVLFPDIGNRCRVFRIGFLRYASEAPFFVSESTGKELQLPPGLTIQL